MRSKAVRAFLLATVLLALPAFLGLYTKGHTGLHLWINAHTRPSLDPLFAYGTELASGWITTVLALVMMVWSWRSGLMLGVSAAASAILAQFFKRAIFPDVGRPSEFLAAMPGLRFVNGVEVLHHNSFPSGHSTCAFSMCFALAVIVGRRAPAVAFALFAAWLAFTRVYLSQHFTEDALAGAFIGTLVAWVVYRWLYIGPFSRRSWLDRGLLRRGSPEMTKGT